MPLQKVLIPVDLSVGINTKEDPYLTNSLTELENGVWTTGSRIRKRNGYDEIQRTEFGTGTTLTFDGLIPFQDELLATGGQKLYAYSSGPEQWSERGGFRSVSVGEDDVVRSNKDVTTPDSCLAGGLILYAWLQLDTTGASEGVYYTVADNASKSILTSRVLLSATAKHPRCLQLGTRLAIVYIETSGTDAVKCALIDEGDHTQFSISTLATDADATDGWLDVDVYNTTENGTGVFCYKSSTANTIGVGYITTSGTVGSIANGLANPTTVSLDAEGGVAICADRVSTDPAYTGYIYTATWKSSDATGLKITKHNAGLTTQTTYQMETLTGTLSSSGPTSAAYTVQSVPSATTFTITYSATTYTVTTSSAHGLAVGNSAYLTISGTTVSAIAPEIDSVGLKVDASSVLQVFYGTHATQTYNHTLKHNTLTIPSGTVGTPQLLLRSTGLVSKPFEYGGKSYVLAVHESALQPTYFLADGDGLLVAKALPGRAGTLPETSMCTSIIQHSATDFQIAGEVRTRLVSVNNDLYSLKGMSRLDFGFQGAANFASQEMGDNLHISGGFIRMYDSSNVCEHSYHIYPENVSGVASGSGGSVGGTYAWRVVYVWTDEHGQIHRSAPSVAVTATLSSNQKYTLTIPTLRLTSKQDVNIEVYRTLDAGTLYFKVGVVANAKTKDTVTFVDGVTGTPTAGQANWITASNLIAKESLYTNGDVVENISAPATKVLGRFANRLWCVSSENPTTLFYSKQRIPYSPVEFTDTFSLQLNRAQEVTALAALDEKLIIFERDAIYYITGTGPTVTGDQSDFSTPSLITGDVGCTNTNSIVRMPLGLMFQSAKGIYLLNRSLETVYIGAPVESYNGLTVTSAELIDDENQIRFLTSDGECLVFDYFYGKWAIWSNHSGLSAIKWGQVNQYVYLRTDGKVFRQSTGYLDGDTPINLRITSPWIKTNGVQGLQRVRRAYILGDWASTHNLKVRVGYNYQQFFNEEHNWDYISALGVTEYGDESPFGSELYGGTSNGVYQFRIHLGQQKCDSVRFRIEDTQTSAESYSISNLMLEVGMKTTGAKLPQTNLV